MSVATRTTTSLGRVELPSCDICGKFLGLTDTHSHVYGRDHSEDDLRAAKRRDEWYEATLPWVEMGRLMRGHVPD